MKTRIISAVVALAIVIPIYIIGGIPLQVLVGILAVLAYKEVLDLKKSHKEIPASVMALGLADLIAIIFYRTEGFYILFGLSYQIIAMLLVTLLLPTLFVKDKDTYNTSDAFYLIGFILLIGVTFNCFILLRDINIWLLVYLFLITCLNDTFAYFFGRLIGKHKLSKISPNKTIEGSVSGFVLGSFVAILFHYYVISNVSLPILIISTLGLSIVGQMGDLLFSKIKRENDIKDFSNIMPGHGGILDRLDSLCLVILAFVLILKML